jgi:16S rRNA (adenine1518-N6/adenine1519-N6)-dimethyltransferase
MFDIIRASFNQRRKTLVNGLHNAPELNVTKDQVVNALHNMNLPETIRGEALTLAQFAELTDLLNFQKVDTKST